MEHSDSSHHPEPSALEKQHPSHMEVARQDEIELIRSSHVKDPKTPEEKALLWKADLAILPFAALCYFVAYLDRNSIGNARIMGFQTDLGLTNEQFFNCLTMFFVGYIAFMLPANLLNRKLKPHWSLGVAVIGWGAVCCGTANAKGDSAYAEVMVLRTLLGVGQAFVQTINLYVSLWYKRDEVATRNGIYYSFATLSGSFGGLIAYGTNKSLSNTPPLPPWGYFFLIEGLLAILVGGITLFLLPRYPDDLQKRKARGKKHWIFTDAQIDLAAERFAKFNTKGETFKPAQLVAVLKDPKSYFFAICQGAAVLGISNTGAFLPTFISQLGFSPLNTQLFTIVPYAFATVTVLTFGILSDRLNTKAPFLLATFAAGSVGYIILLSTTNAVAGIVATVLITAGCYVPVILVPVWMFINTGGYTKRASTWPFCEVVGLSWSIMGSRIYDGAPRFIKGHSVVLSINCVALLSVCAAYFYMRRENRRRDRIEREYAERGEVHPHIAQGLTLEHVQDYHIAFRYVL